MNKTLSRGMTLAAGVVMMMAVGIIHGWSVMSAPYSSVFGWTSDKLGLTYSLALTFMTLGIFLASFLVKKTSARTTVRIGAALVALGFFLCSLVQQNDVWMVYLGNGCMGGLGAGFVYNAVQNTVMQRFSDRKGFASGTLLLGFGVSVLILGNLASLLFRTNFGWRNVFRLFSVMELVIQFLGSLFLVEGKEDNGNTAYYGGHRQFSPKEVLQTVTFWLLFLIIFFEFCISSGVNGHGSYIVAEAGVPELLCPLIVGLYSVVNGVSRFFWGLIYDRFGKMRLMYAGFTCYFIATLLLIVGLSRKIPVITSVGYVMVGLAYAQTIICLSTITLELFGQKDFMTNYALANSGSAIASFSATLAGALQTSTGSFLLPMKIFCAISVAALMLILAFKKVSKPWID